MDTMNNMLDKKDLSSKIIMAAAAILFLMILFPPKVVSKNLFGQRLTEPAGYQFILADPAGAQKSVTAGLPDDITNAMFAGSGVEYGKLFIQLIVVIGIAGAAVKLLAKQPSAQMEATASTL
jgi:hypothetical protein